jgi:trehalose 6-phosphate synthase
MNTPGRRLVIASNRLPVVIQKDGSDSKVYPGSGGLVTAMAPVLRNRGGLWIGWPGTSEEIDLGQLEEVGKKTAGYSLKPVMLTEEEKEKFYLGFSNEIIWPLFHDLQSQCNFDPDYWEAYKRVNRKFAEVIVQNLRKRDYIWVHDYHLMNAAGELREMGVDSKIGYFLHIPFPPLDIFLKLPWRFQILRSLLEYDLIGLQTLRDRRNFIQCVRALIKGIPFQGKGQVITAQVDGREVRLGSFPIGIDYEEFSSQTSSKEVAEKAWQIHEELPNRRLILGIDRLDYSKGIPYKLQAYRNALSRYPELIGKITLIQVVVPSREDIPKYNALRTEIEQLVGEINGQFTKPGWIPIHYIFRSLSRSELLAYYRTSEIALVTPLKDGMNVVAKEYCASNLSEHGALILSEFAGAAAQLQNGALLVNPYDIEGMADAIYRAYGMDSREKQKRMKKLRQSVAKQNIFWWVDSFLDAAFAKYLGDFPLLEDYMPNETAPVP